MLYRRLNLEQGTSEWHDFRRTVIGASDAPTIMGENPWRTVAYLQKEKRGQTSSFSGNAATRRGAALEPVARGCYERERCVRVSPAVLQNTRHEWQAASVDGIDSAGNIVVEIKCGRKAFEYVQQNRKVPPYYYGQLQHILAVTGLEAIDYYSYFPNYAAIYLKIARDEKYIARLLEAEYAFYCELQGIARRPAEAPVLVQAVRKVVQDQIPGPGLVVAADAAQEQPRRSDDPFSPGSPVETPSQQPQFGYVGETKNGQWHGFGTYRWENGDYYIGEWRNGLRTGVGRYVWSSGMEHVGQFLEGVVTGQGKRTWPNGDMYEGTWARNDRHGRGIMRYVDGGEYEGEWAEGKRSGQGAMRLPGGDIRAGTWVNDYQEGPGTYTWASGGQYTGHFSQGFFEGQGTRVYVTGGCYTGLWRRYKRHGKGRLQYADGGEYSGDWSDDRRHGHGTLKTASGDVYEGQWSNDQIEGSGSYTWANGARYVGEFAGGQCNGRGTMRSADGEIYEGEWKGGLRHGRGVQTGSDDSTYRGDWAENLRDGHGILFLADRTRIFGTWKKGVLEGEGRIVEPDGQERPAVWNKGKLLEGEHLHVSPDGCVYDGCWKNGQRSGVGTQTWPNGERYSGHWSINLFDGHGTRRYSDGTVYVGLWSRGLRHGQGIQRDSRGASIVGRWRNDKYIAARESSGRDQSRAAIHGKKRDASRPSRARVDGHSDGYLWAQRLSKTRLAGFIKDYENSSPADPIDRLADACSSPEAWMRLSAFLEGPSAVRAQEKGVIGSYVAGFVEGAKKRCNE